MKIELTIDDEELKRVIVEKIAYEATMEIWGNNYDETSKEKRQKILNKINWKGASEQLGDIIVQKFFSKLLDK